MPVEKINISDSLRKGTDKLNEVIDLGNQIVVDAANAVNTSNTALSTANTAKTTADATATQLETVIIESGTSDAEVLAARTDGNTAETFATVGGRLDRVTLQINASTYLAKSIEKMTYGQTVDGIAIGDSMTFGRGTGTDSSQVANPYPKVLQDQLRSIFNNQTINVINKGVSGNTSTLILNRLNADVISLSPSFCMVMTGYNDVGTNMSLSTFRSNMESITKQLKEANIEVVLIATAPNFTAQYNQKIEPYNRITKETAEKYSVGFVDVFEETMQRYARGSETPLVAQPDQVHFEASRYKIIADQIINTVFTFLDVDKQLKPTQRLYVPTVNNPSVVAVPGTNILTNSKMRTGESFYLVAGSSDILNFPFVVKQKNVRLKMVIQRYSAGGTADVYDGSTLLKQVSGKSPSTGNGLFDCEVVLFENIPVGYHNLNIKGVDVLVGTFYVSEFIFESYKEETGAIIPFTFGTGTPQLTFNEIEKIFKKRVKFKNLSTSGNGTLNKESSLLELKTGKLLIAEFVVKASAGTGVSWFGNILNYSAANPNQLSNFGYMFFFNSASEIRFFKASNTGGLVALTPHATGLSLNFANDMRIRVEQTDAGVTNIYLDGALIKTFTDTDYISGHCGIYGQTLNAELEIKDSTFYYV